VHRLLQGGEAIRQKITFARGEYVRFVWPRLYSKRSVQDKYNKYGPGAAAEPGVTAKGFEGYFDLESGREAERISRKAAGSIKPRVVDKRVHRARGSSTVFGTILLSPAPASVWKSRRDAMFIETSSPFSRQPIYGRKTISCAPKGATKSHGGSAFL
jgi:hypothetical protein